MQIKNVKQTFLIFLSLLILSFSFYSYAEEASSADKNIFLDSDQDGLSDEEEKTYGTDPQNSDTDGDGYSDSVEIKNGYNPLMPAPGDKIVEKEEIVRLANLEATEEISEEKNLTKKVAEKISQLAAEESSASETSDLSLNSDSETASGLTAEELQDAIGEVIEENVQQDILPEVSVEEIKIKNQNYSKLSEEERTDRKKEDFANYTASLFYIFSSNSPTPITSGSDVNSAFSHIQNKIARAVSSRSSSELNDLEKSNKIVLEQLKEVEVPAELADIHIQALRLMKHTENIKGYVDPIGNDPIGDIANLSRIQNFTNEMSVFSEEATQRIKNYGITYDDDMKKRLKTQGVILPEENKNNEEE